MTQQPAPTIAIIGGGFSGTMVAIQLLRHATRPMQIKLIERRPIVGVGVAYSTPFNCHLLNVPVGNMSAFADAPDHFLQWLQAQSWLPNSITAASFVPRKWYGRYLQSILTEAIAMAPPGVSLETREEEVTALYRTEAGAILSLSQGQTLIADRVVLALGNFAPSDPPVADPTFYRSERYIGYAWSARALKAIDPHEPVLLIGSGLTMVDWVVALRERGHRGKIYSVSRRGLLSQPHQPALPYPDLSLPDPLPSTVRAGFQYVRQTVREAVEQGYDWRSVIDALRPHTPDLWRSLSWTERQRFLRHGRSYWDVHRHRLAPKIADILMDCLNSGQLTLYAGRIQAYEEQPTEVAVTIRQRQGDMLTLRVGRVVNCTGPDCSSRQFSSPLVSHLMQSGFIQPDPLNLGLEVADDGALLDQTGQASTWLYTIGSPQKGNFWETTAVPEIRVQAVNLAQTLLGSVKAEGRGQKAEVSSG